jgi:hypothetical protein
MSKLEQLLDIGKGLYLFPYLRKNEIKEINRNIHHLASLFAFRMTSICFFEKHPHKKKDIQFIQNPSVTWEYIKEKYIDNQLYQTINHFDTYVSYNPHLTIDIIETYSHMIKWSWHSLSENKKIATSENIKKYPYQKWDFRVINTEQSSNLDLTWEFIEKHIEQEWDWRVLSANPHITLEIIRSHPEKNWNLSVNPHITWEIIINNDWNWDWYLLSYHPCITCEIIHQNIDKPWNWFMMSYNPNLNWEFIEMYIDQKWNWNVLNRTKF